MNLVSARLASISDCKSIYQWRNDPITRKMSKNKNFIVWSDHVNWFKRSFFSNDNKLIICELGSSDKIAFLKFKLIKESALVSINLNPNFRGQGFAKHCLLNSIDLLKKETNKVKLLNAEIREENIASIKTFMGSGFTLNKMSNDIAYYQKKLD